MSEFSEPIVVDLGKRKGKHLKALDRGFGPAAEDVQDAIAHLRAQLGPEADGKDIVPVVVVYERRRRKQKLPF